MFVPPDVVTTVVIVLAPTLKAMAPEVPPDATVVPFTVTVEPAAATVGVTVIDVVEFDTDAV